ncbi:MAG: SRPBCC family protein [Myxococcota bacterium]|nr:SRPBCC family protein [Myxococcota bacterium]
MTLGKLPVGLLAIVIAGSICPATWAGISLSEQEMHTLVTGGLVKRPLPTSRQNSTLAGVSFALINAPTDVVWRALEDISAWPRIFPNTHEARVVAAQGNVRAVRMRMGNRLIKLTYFLSVHFDKDNLKVGFALNKNKPRDVDECRGYVRLIAQPGNRTLVAFSSLAKMPFGPLIRLVGDKVLGWIENRMLSMPERLKKWIEAPSPDNPDATGVHPPKIGA